MKFPNPNQGGEDFKVMDVLTKPEINQQIQWDKAFGMKLDLIFIHKFDL